jgi:hypothetical protein
MNCPVEGIQLLAAGDQFEPKERESIQDHLGACSACQQLFRQYSRLGKELGNLKRVEVPLDFSMGVLWRVRSHKQVVFSSPREWRLAAAFTLAMMALGGICVVLGEGVKSAGANVLDLYILQSFSFLADMLATGFRTAIAVGQAGLVVIGILAGLMHSMGKWLITLPGTWLALGFSLFALSHGTLFWMLRRYPTSDRR